MYVALKIKIYKTIILPVVLYGYETWSPLRKEHWLRVFKNRILRRIIGPKRDEKLYSLYHSPNVIRVIKSIRLKWAGHVAWMKENKSAFKILSSRPKPTAKWPLGRPRRIWEDNIRKDLKGISINTWNWVDSSQDRNYWRTLVNAALNLRVP